MPALSLSVKRFTLARCNKFQVIYCFSFSVPQNNLDNVSNTFPVKYRFLVLVFGLKRSRSEI